MVDKQSARVEKIAPAFYGSRERGTQRERGGEREGGVRARARHREEIKKQKAKNHATRSDFTLDSSAIESQRLQHDAPL